MAIKEVVGFPGYFITDGGELYSQNYRGCRGSKELERRKTQYTRLGYEVTRLSRQNVLFTRFIHRLVLEAFVGPRPEGMECCHGPKGKKDNSLANLSWGTRKKNRGDDIKRDGIITWHFGEKNGSSKLKEAEVRKIKALFGKITNAQIARTYGVSNTTIWNIRRGHIWKWVA